MDYLENNSETNDRLGTIYKNLSGLDLSTEDMDLPVSVYNFLKRNGIHTLEQLLSMSADDLDGFKGIKNRNREQIYYIIFILQELSKDQKISL